ncbi:MAG: DUF58 domain-containing protein [Acidobacteria bacterium]|nr:DUF58 domain-containing protein [Acidobacteriota bacterium]
MSKLRKIRELFSVRDLRNALVGLAVVFAGIGLAVLTVVAHRSGERTLAITAAVLSLVFVLLILIFVVPPLARNASREASQMNLPFEFTLGGAIMLGLLVIVGFSAWNTGNNLLFLVLSILVGAMIAGFAAGAMNLKKLDVRMRFPETIFACEETPILVGLTNRKRLFPAFSIVAEVRGRDRERSLAEKELGGIVPPFIMRRLAKPPVIRRILDYFPYVARGETEESRSFHTFPHRGRLVISDFEIATKFPFAFFRHRRRLSAKETELVVFPQLAEQDDLPDVFSAVAGRRPLMKRGAGYDLLSLRAYQPTDDPRQIDWKATARSRGVIVRETAADESLRVQVFFDLRLPTAEEKRLTLREIVESEREGRPQINERFEAAVSRAAAVIDRLIESEAEVRLVIGEDVGDFGSGARHLHDCLKRLAYAEPIFTDDRVPINTAEINDDDGFTAGADTTVLLVAEELLPVDLEPSDEVLPVKF